MEDKKKKVEKLKTKLDLISIQKDVLDEKDMKNVTGGNEPGTCTECTSGLDEEPKIVFFTTG